MNFNKIHIEPMLRKKENCMATAKNKFPENVTGKYYVDDTCIDCDMCRGLAPSNFTRRDIGDSYVFKQPSTLDEELQCKEAKESCPADAIGDDGI